jgi:hypothetical protein
LSFYQNLPEVEYLNKAYGSLDFLRLNQENKFLVTAFALHVRVKSLSLTPPQICYLTVLSVLRVYNFDDRMTNEYKVVGGITICSRNGST